MNLKIHEPLMYAHEIKNSRGFFLCVFLGKEEQNPTPKSTFNRYFSAMHEVEMIGFCVFLNTGVVNLSHIMSKRQLLKT